MLQNFVKALLDVSDNLGRASSVVKESFSKIDVSKDTTDAVPLLKTLLEGVEMTDKQLSEVHSYPISILYHISHVFLTVDAGKQVSSTSTCVCPLGLIR